MISNQWFKLLRRWRVAAARRRGVTCADDLRLGADVDGVRRNYTVHHSVAPAAL